MVLFVLCKRACAAIRSGAWCLMFYRTLRLLPYFMCANSEGSGETARMRKLAWSFAGRLCGKYHKLMSWLICLFFSSTSTVQDDDILSTDIQQRATFLLFIFNCDIPIWWLYQFLHSATGIIFFWGSVKVIAQVLSSQNAIIICSITFSIIKHYILNYIAMNALLVVFGFSENTPPFFLTNWTRRLNISFENTKQFVLDLKALVGDKQDKVDQLTFTLVTTINNTDFYLSKSFEIIFYRVCV